jgi:lysozyme
MKYSLSGLHLTEQFEGCKLVAYQDQKGVWTIGYGHTKDVYQGKRCTQAQAEQWLAEDVAEAEAAVNRLVHVPLNQNQFDALVDLVFNVGYGNFAGSTLLRLLNIGAYDRADDEFAKWNWSGGIVREGLTRRRLAEKNLFNKVP